MANAKKSLAPSEEIDVLGNPEDQYPAETAALKQKFDPKKKYMFELATENDPRELPIMVVQNNKATVDPHRRFKPYLNIVFTSQVVWKGERRNLRYYDGCTSIFQDEQP